MEFSQGGRVALGVYQSVGANGVRTASLHPLDEELDRVLLEGIYGLGARGGGWCTAWYCRRCSGRGRRWCSSCGRVLGCCGRCGGWEGHVDDCDHRIRQPLAPDLGEMLGNAPFDRTDLLPENLDGDGLFPVAALELLQSPGGEGSGPGNV